MKLALKVIEKRRLNSKKKVEHAMNERSALQQLACILDLGLILTIHSGVLSSMPPPPHTHTHGPCAALFLAFVVNTS